MVSLWAAGALLLALALAGLGLLALLAPSAVAGGGAAPLLSLLAPHRRDRRNDADARPRRNASRCESGVACTGGSVSWVIHNMHIYTRNMAPEYTPDSGLRKLAVKKTRGWKVLRKQGVGKYLK